MQKEVNIALAQISCKLGDKEKNIEKMEKYIKTAKEKKAHIIVFPELSTTGYITRDLIYELAEPIPGPTTQKLEKMAKIYGISIVFGAIEKSAKAHSVVYNTAVLIGPHGYIGKYRKMHLPTHSVFEEKRYFRAGYNAPVFDTDYGNLGLIICYDIFFPELSRLIRLQGTQLIICISASPSVRRKFFETLTIARAMENNVFFAYTNLVGLEDGLQFWGGSRLVDPNGNILAQAKYDEEDLVVAKINYEDLNRTGIFVPTLRDLRNEIYDMLRNQVEKL